MINAFRRMFASRRPPVTSRPRTTRPAVESLEDRTVPAAIVVSNMDDDVNGDTDTIDELIADDGGDGISLREALMASNNGGFGNTVTFQAGLTGVLTLTGGQMTIGRSVTITGNGAANTVIDANLLTRIFDVTNVAGSVTLDGLTLRNGRTTADNDNGGAIRYGPNATLTVRNCVLSNNATEGTNAPGGAISAYSGAVTVINSTLTGNFTKGSSSSGGAIFTISFPMTVTGSVLTNNHTEGTFAAGGALGSLGVVAVSNSTLSGNYTLGNSSGGGAIGSNSSFESATITVTNSTLSGNYTEGTGSGGGGIFSQNSAVTLHNSTVAFNEARNAAGGGINSFSADVTLNNSILAKNTDDGAAPDLRPSPNGDDPLTITSSLIGDNTGTGLTVAATPDANGNLIGGSGASALDPRLAPLASNGGRTQTHALLADSPAINRGRNALLPVGVTTDQRGAGFPRIDGTSVDMGAFEMPINNAPVNIRPGLRVLRRNTLFRFSGVNRLRVTDVDAGSALVRVTLGTLRLATTRGLRAVSANNRPTIVLIGTVAALNAALNNLTFTPIKNRRGTAVLTMLTNDQGGTGLGGAKTDRDLIPLRIV